MEPLELSTRFVTDSEHKKSINQILNLVSRDYFYAKNYLSYNTIKNSILRIINPFYLSTLTTLHDTTKFIFDEYTLLNIENHI